MWKVLENRDAKLIQAAQTGDLEAFNRLVLEHQEVVYSLAYQVLDNEDDASEAAQEIFLCAFKQLATYSGGSFRSWLLRIAVLYCQEKLRRRPIRSMRLTTSRQPTSTLSSELGNWMDRLASLPNELRLAVALVDIEGIPYDEAAAALDIPVQAVQSWLAQARSQMLGY